MMAAGSPESARVLLVDGSLDSHFVQRLKSVRDLSVEHAPTGRDGLDAARRERFDVIVLEPMLPDTGGLGVLAKLRTDGINTPVVIVTRVPDTDSALECGRLGVTRYLKKPCPLEALVRAVREAARSILSLDDRETRTRNLWWLKSAASDPLFERAYSEDLRQIQDITSRMGDGLGKRELERQLILSATEARTLLGLHVIADGVKLMLTTGDAEVDGLDRVRRRLAAIPLKALHPKVLQALKEIEIHYDEIGSHSVLGQRLHAPATDVGRRLREATGLTFHVWRRLGRLRASLFEMTDESTRLKEVAHSAHWSSQHQFNHVFRRTFGVSPGTFRRKYFHAIDGIWERTLDVCEDPDAHAHSTRGPH